MNVEINIKIPIGQGVSVSQDVQTTPEAEYGPPLLPEPAAQGPGVSAESPPSLEQLGLTPESEPFEAPSGMEPPSLSELGLSADWLAEAEVAAEPPSLEMLEGYGDAAESDEGLGPPAVEELELAPPEVGDELAPPPVEALEGGLPADAEPTADAPPTSMPRKRKR